MPLRLLLVDDHAMVRDGLTRLLERANEAWEILGVSSALEALGVLYRGGIDIAIIDLSMPGMSGLDLIRRVRNEFPEVRMLVLSMHAEEQYATRAFKAGAMGYLTKDRAGVELVDAIRKLASGGTFLSDELAQIAVRQLRGDDPRPWHEKLTDRELDVLRRIAAGERISEIASALNLSIKTVSTHKTRVQQKLGLAGTAALIRFGLEQGLAPGAGSTTFPDDAQEEDWVG